jgi:hypothetical protein
MSLKCGFYIATQLNANGEDVKTAQQTLGHSNPKLTMDVYMQAVPSLVRAAHDRLVDMVMMGPLVATTADALSGPLLAPDRSGASVSC